MKKLFAILMALMLLVSSMLLMTSCNGDKGGDEGGGGNEPTTATYTVRLVNPDGSAAENVVVKLMKGDAQVTLARVDAEGKVSFTVDKGDYTVELIPVGEFNYSYDRSSLNIAADSNGTVINLYDTPVGYEGGMRGVSAGHYIVNLGSDELTYFVFTGKARGEYELYATDLDGNPLDIGYYGAPINPLAYNIGEIREGKMYIEIRNMNLASDTMEATPYLIGIKGAGAEQGFLHVVKTDTELEFNAQEINWIDRIPYEKPPVTQQIGYDNVDVRFTNLDITDPSLTVVKGADGYYHLGTADGPVVYMRITTASPYIAPFKDINESGQLCRYFYEDGKFKYKEHYGVAMNAYIAAADVKSGVYPLDEGLKYIVQNTGEYLGWWNESAMNYLFTEVNEVTENAWLFACCIIETEKVGADSSAPVIVGDEGKLLLSAGDTVYLTYTAAAGETVTLSGVPEGAYVTVGEQTLTPANGKITVIFVSGVNNFSITYTGEGGDVVVSYTLG